MAEPVLDPVTIGTGAAALKYLGYSANDAPLPEEEAEFAEIERLQQFYQNQQQDYTVQQFVEPGEAGGTTGGLPAYGVNAPADWNYFGSSGAVPIPLPVPRAPVAPAPAAPAPPPPSGEIDASQ